jgi:hypothetical protein
LATAAQIREVIVEIGGVPVCLRTESDEFRQMLEERYTGFLGGRPGSAGVPQSIFELDVELLPEGAVGPDEDVRVRRESSRWVMTRGDFRAEFEPGQRRGSVRQTANPYAIDSVLRILHTLVLAEEGGFLLHAASAIRNGKAFLFSGKSEAGKTTISRLAPADVVLLTDEISYIKKEQQVPRGLKPTRDDTGKTAYLAFGTPFAGELAKAGENVSAPVAGIYFLEKAAENSITPIGTAEALFRLMQNILFFAEDSGLVQRVFEAAGEFVLNVPAYRLAFVPDQKVWELIR